MSHELLVLIKALFHKSVISIALGTLANRSMPFLSARVVGGGPRNS